MTWSLQILNGLETAFRTFEFVKHIHDEAERALSGRGMETHWIWTNNHGEVHQVTLTDFRWAQVTDLASLDTPERVRSFVEGAADLISDVLNP